MRRKKTLLRPSKPLNFATYKSRVIQFVTAHYRFISSSFEVGRFLCLNPQYKHIFQMHSEEAIPPLNMRNFRTYNISSWDELEFVLRQFSNAGEGAIIYDVIDEAKKGLVSPHLTSSLLKNTLL